MSWLLILEQGHPLGELSPIVKPHVISALSKTECDAISGRNVIKLLQGNLRGCLR
jgi:hypothetical protein